MKRVILSVWVASAFLLALAGCGGKSSSSTSTTAVSVTISPTSVSLATAATQQFTATVTNSTNTAVSWQVNSVAGGNSTVGFISSTGLYTAPNAVPTPATVTVAAISQADTTKSAVASVTITAPTTPSASMVVAPSFVNVPAGGQQAFTATVNGNAIAVTWTLNCQSQATNGCGSISTGGVYTAPLSPPPGAIVSITARANDNSVAPSNAIATIQFSNGSLNGQYAFLLSGQNAGVSYLAGGSISFDGNGNITGGILDINSGGSVPPPATINASGSTYHVGTDGRGNATVATTAGTFAWQIAVVNHSHVYLSRFDSGTAGASGTMELQDSAQFGSAKFSGNYAFNLSGANSGGKPGTLAAAGALTSDGAGTISSGLIDVNSAGTTTPNANLTGSYGAPSSTTGRGTLTMTSTFAAGQTFAYYIIDAAHVRVIETDATNQLAGDLVAQPAGPFTAANFRGGVVFAILGSTSQKPLAEGAVLTLDGAGHVSNGTMDINSDGTLVNNASAVSGTITVSDATTGRATVSLLAGSSTLQYVFYPQSNGAFSLVEVDTANTAAGRALPQAAGSFSGGTLSGNYAMNLTGTDLTTNPGQEDVIGQIVPNGGSALSGTVNIFDNGPVSPAASLSGSYQVANSGRGTATMSTSSTAFASGLFTFYIADSGDVLFVETDSNRVLVGRLEKQF